jgi:hypothetical protein
MRRRDYLADAVGGATELFAGCTSAGTTDPAGANYVVA